MKTSKLLSINLTGESPMMLSECIVCRVALSRSIKHQGIPTTCKGCKTDQINPTLPKSLTKYKYVCPICNYEFDNKEDAANCCSGED